MKAIITAIIVLVSTVGSVLSYPIDPRPLRKLIMESEFIIIGRVLDVKETKSDSETISVARIRIKEVLQGKIVDEIIEVPFYPNYICPAPAQYSSDTDVLVFLDKKKGTYRTHALSYGAKTMSEEDLEVYKSRILEMQTILEASDSHDKFFQTVEWLVKCAEHKATRWEGTFELSPESDFMSHYAQSEMPAFQSMLSANQRDRLKIALFSEAGPDYTDMGLVDLVYRGNEMEVHQYLLEHLKKLSDDQLWYGEAFMERVLQGKNTEEMESQIKKFSEKQFAQNTRPEELKHIINEFIALAEK